jgi:hypothetical protein
VSLLARRARGFTAYGEDRSAVWNNAEGNLESAGHTPSRTRGIPGTQRAPPERPGGALQRPAHGHPQRRSHRDPQRRSTVCTRHGIWLSDHGQPLLEVTTSPDIIAAQHRANRLLRRYTPQELMLGMQAATKAVPAWPAAPSVMPTALEASTPNAANHQPPPRRSYRPRSPPERSDLPRCRQPRRDDPQVPAVGQPCPARAKATSA